MDEKGIFDYARETDTILILTGSEPAIDKNFFYLSGIESGVFEGSLLIVTPDSTQVITGALEEETARASGHEVIVFHNKAEKEEIIRRSLKNSDVVGLNYSAMTLSMYTNLLRIVPEKAFVDVSPAILEARRFKTPEELSRIREAGKIASEVFDMVLEKIHEGMTENEVASELVHEMMKLGATGPSFETIVAFGANASMPHYTPGKTKLKPGDLVLMDYGALYKRYCSDITRTVVLGRASEQQKNMHSVVLEAQKKGMEAIRENVNGKDVDMAARSVIDASEFKGRFIHSLGHGLGMDVHDHPALSSNLDFPLKSSMVVTVEPGVYIPKVGGLRIEDDVVVKKDGYELLTNAPRDLVEL